MIKELIPLSKGTLDVLNKLIRIDHPVNLSDLSRATNVTVPGVLKIIRKLEKANIVKVNVVGKSSVVYPVYDSKNIWVFSLIEKYNFDIFLLEHKKLKPLLIELKKDLEGLVDFSLIFGSYASEEASEESDLDILIVCKNENKDLVLKIIKENSVLSNIRLSPIVTQKKEFIKNYEEKHRLYLEIVKGKRVLINGEHEFWKLILEML